MQAVKASMMRRWRYSAALPFQGFWYRFQAVRGTIITTAGFSKGAMQAAFEAGAPPITLIDGSKLIDLLIEYGIGVRTRSVEVLELDADAFAQTEEGEDS